MIGDIEVVGSPGGAALAAWSAERFRQRLDRQFLGLSRLLAGANLEALRSRSSGGAWSAHEHLAHLGRFQEEMVSRLKRIQGEESPRFERYRAEDDPGFAPWTRLETEALVRSLAKGRKSLVEAITETRQPDFARIGIHPVFGAMPAGLWIEFFLAHEAHHHYLLFRTWREAESKTLQLLDTAVRFPTSGARLEAIIAAVETKMRVDQSLHLAWQPVDLDIFEGLPPSVQSCWVFVLRQGSTTGAERHPNSIQRVVSYRGTADLQTWETDGWRSNRLTSLGDPLHTRWLSIPANVWHKPVIGPDNWVVVSFHTALADQLLEERAINDHEPHAGAYLAGLYVDRSAR